MIERIVVLLLGCVFFYALRFYVIQRPLSGMHSTLVAAVVMCAGIQFHYTYLPHDTFQGGVTYVSLGFIAFLVLQLGSRRPPSRSDGGR